jgi:hypothetical protein
LLDKREWQLVCETLRGEIVVVIMRQIADKK